MKLKRLPLLAHSIRTRHLLFSTSLPLHSIPLPKQRSMPSLMKLLEIKQLFTSAIVCPPVVSATRSPYLITVRSFKLVLTRNFWQTKTANTTSFGRLKHNIIRNKNTAESNHLVALGVYCYMISPLRTCLYRLTDKLFQKQSSSHYRLQNGYFYDAP